VEGRLNPPLPEHLGAALGATLTCQDERQQRVPPGTSSHLVAFADFSLWRYTSPTQLAADSRPALCQPPGRQQRAAETPPGAFAAPPGIRPAQSGSRPRAGRLGSTRSSQVGGLKTRSTPPSGGGGSARTRACGRAWTDGLACQRPGGPTGQPSSSAPRKQNIPHFAPCGPARNRRPKRMAATDSHSQIAHALTTGAPWACAASPSS
jgi:hypothetical protein